MREATGTHPPPYLQQTSKRGVLLTRIREAREKKAANNPRKTGMQEASH